MKIYVHAKLIAMLLSINFTLYYLGCMESLLVVGLFMVFGLLQQLKSSYCVYGIKKYLIRTNIKSYAGIKEEIVCENCCNQL